MATNTKNYNFKKPDESDFYDIQDQNGNWDIADEKMEELSAPTFEDYSGTTSVPEASTAIEAIKSKKKIPEILANIKAAFKGVCLLGHIVNNCVTDNAKLPLSAAQGKALMDQITKLNSDLKVLYYGAIVGTEDSVVPSNTQTVAYSFNVDAGVYIAFANIRWSSNAKGSRHIGFAEKTTEAFADMNAHYSIVAPSTDGMTFQNLAVILKYENPAHVDIRVQQFSGGDLKIRTRLSLLKVKS